MKTIKILKSDSVKLTGKTLHLEKMYDNVWACSKTNIRIIDPWDELEWIDVWVIKYNTKVFDRIHMYMQTKEGDAYIHEVEYIPTVLAKLQ